MDYQKVYNRLIERARRESRVKVEGGTYYEAHHILPKCMGGGGKTSQWRTHPNIILLTAREHFIAHRLLHATHPHNEKIRQALWAMSNQREGGRVYKVSSRLYEVLRIAHVDWLKHRRVVTQESAERIRQAAIDRGNQPIDQYTLTGVFIRNWKSIKAIHQELGINIVSNLRGVVSQAGGFVWVRQGQDPKVHVAKVEQVESFRETNRKSVIQYTITGDVVNIWPSIREASITLTINRASIKKVLEGERKTAGGFIWKHKP